MSVLSSTTIENNQLLLPTLRKCELEYERMFTLAKCLEIQYNTLDIQLKQCVVKPITVTELSSVSATTATSAVTSTNNDENVSYRVQQIRYAYHRRMAQRRKMRQRMRRCNVDAIAASQCRWTYTIIPLLKQREKEGNVDTERLIERYHRVHTELNCVIPASAPDHRQHNSTTNPARIKYLMRQKQLILSKQHGGENQQHGTIHHTNTSCRYCFSDVVLYLVNESIYICRLCGRVRNDLSTNDRGFNYNEAPEKSSNIYIRQTHFRDKLNAMQGRQHRKIPLDVIRDVKQQLLLDTIDFSRVTRMEVRHALKILGKGYKDWYDFDMLIACQINGTQPLRFTETQEHQLFCDFNQIQKPFDDCPLKYEMKKDNFINYNFTIFKLIQMHGWYEFLPHFQLLKSERKLSDLLRIWKYICDQLNWPYIEMCNAYPTKTLDDIFGF